MKLIIQNGKQEDADAMAVLEALSFSDPWSAESFRQTLALPVTRCLTAWIEDEGELLLVGYLIAFVIAPEVEIANLAVSPAYRKQGIGRALMEEGLGICEAEGCDSFYLEVRESNLLAQALYRRLGFELVGRRKHYYRLPTEDALLMARMPDRTV